MDSHGFANQPGDVGQASKKCGLHVADRETGVALQLGGSIHDASASVEADGSSSSSPQASHPPGGSREGEAAHGEDVWYGNMCLVEEVPLDQDMVI